MASSRRAFLLRISSAAAAALALPRRLQAGGRGTIPAPDRSFAWPPPDGTLPPEFWEQLRGQFLMPLDEAFFNTGTLGASPRSVLDAVVAHMTHVDRDIAHWDYKADTENYFTGYAPEDWVRSKLARLINADTAEIALTQNATFGMNFVANGLMLEAADEVLVMEGAHPGGRCGWELRAKRHGTAFRPLPLPDAPLDPAKLVAMYEDATTPRTRVWAIPHLTSGTAILFPVDELCRRARQRGIVSVVDGAQTLGHLAVDVRAMGCDVYFSSPHKWLLAPKGTGILYVRRDLQPRLWTTLASTEWDNGEAGAYRLMQYGTGNLSLLVGLERATDFHLELRPSRIEDRIMTLANRLRAGLQELPHVAITSPLHPELLSATTVWRVDGMTGEALQDALWQRARIRVRSMGVGVRQCCHVYNLEAEIDRTLEAALRLAPA
jgi:isopenicillin-N epimerase